MANQEVIAELKSQIEGILAHGGAPSEKTGAHVAKTKRNAPFDADSATDIQLSAENSQRDARAALKKIVALVNASDKSERSIRKRLADDEYDQNVIDEAVSKAKDYGFIDDTRYAEVLIRSRISQCKGSVGIVRELAENGIDADTVDGWPFDFPVSHDEEIDRALSLLDRKPPHSKNKREAAYRRLMQKGYPSSVSSSAARIWVERSY